MFDVEERMVTYMHNEFRKTASEVKVGDTVIEHDGALLDVISVRRASGYVVLGLRGMGALTPLTARLRPKTLVRCFEMQR